MFFFSHFYHGRSKKQAIHEYCENSSRKITKHWSYWLAVTVSYNHLKLRLFPHFISNRCPKMGFKTPAYIGHTSSFLTWSGGSTLLKWETEAGVREQEREMDVAQKEHPPSSSTFLLPIPHHARLPSAPAAHHAF